MKQDKMQELEKIILRDYGNIAGMMVLKNGKTLYEGTTLVPPRQPLPRLFRNQEHYFYIDWNCHG